MYAFLTKHGSTVAGVVAQSVYTCAIATGVNGLTLISFYGKYQTQTS